MPLPLVIVNPASADGATRENWPKFASDLRTHFGSYSVAMTEAPGHARILAADAARQGNKFIIACGGDGTISEVANGIIDSGSESELGILPAGTGSDFRRSIGVSNHVADAARALRSGRTKVIDAVRVAFINESGERETRYSINVASFGMSTDVLDRAARGEAKKWVPAFTPRRVTSRLSYAAATVQTTFTASPADIFLQIDDEQERRLRLAELCVANARYYGGAMKIAPNAKLDDGYFDVVTIGDATSFRLLTNAPRLYFGAHLRMSEVTHALANRVIARPANKDKEVRIELDGEVVGRLPSTFEIIPRALRVRFP